MASGGDTPANAAFGRVVRILLLLLFPILSHAGEIKLAWDASPSTNVVGYILYAGTNNPALTNVAERINTGTNQTVVVDFVKRGSWFFWVTAHEAQGVESEPSNIVQVQVPEPPANARTVVIEATVDLSSTNWSEKAFLRLRLP